ncbi:MAG: hypothetical protein ACLPN1_16030 [Dissulfurispiraceae bacterium]|jgi:hypothetical protein
MNRAPYVFRTYVLKCLFISVLGILIFTLPAFAAGGLVMSPLQYDCGTLDEGTPAVMDVEIKNIGDADVTIKNVRTN